MQIDTHFKGISVSEEMQNLIDERLYLCLYRFVHCIRSVSIRLEKSEPSGQSISSQCIMVIKLKDNEIHTTSVISADEISAVNLCATQLKGRILRTQSARQSSWNRRPGS